MSCGLMDVEKWGDGLQVTHIPGNAYAGIIRIRLNIFASEHSVNQPR
jgi:hypothetical protein